jgi:hypothetical protein
MARPRGDGRALEGVVEGLEEAEFFLSWGFVFGRTEPGDAAGSF